MNNGSYRFKLGEFECVSLSDGSVDYPLQNFFANVPTAQVEYGYHILHGFMHILDDEPIKRYNDLQPGPHMGSLVLGR